MNHPPMVANQKLALWRWMTVAAVLVIIAVNARPWSWAIMLGYIASVAAHFVVNASLFT
jgi:hypothetical protein